jgi:hypothetical protein
MKRLFVGFCLLISCVAQAQHFTGESQLPAVDIEGFYRIGITPELAAYLKADGTNIRLFSKKEEVPYLLQSERANSFSEEFKAYEIVEKRQVKNCCTIVTLRNPEGTSINNIILSIKNADVHKQATLLGSDDQRDWFALKDRFSITSVLNEQQTSEIKIIDFPLSNYVYYQLQIDDSSSAPLNVLKAGYFKVNNEDGKYTALNQVAVSKSDSLSEKITYLNITLDTLQWVDRLVLSMSGAPYFLRHATLLVQRERINKKKELEVYFEEALRFEVNSRKPSVLDLHQEKVKKLLIKIENEDNPPLQQATLGLYQLNRYIVAWLKPGEKYSLKIGDVSMQAPKYDLVFFEDKVPQDAPTLMPAQVVLFSVERQNSESWFTNRIIIWIAIGVITVAMIMMSVRLVKEASSKKHID